MTKTFEDREKGFERKFAYDEEMQFRATARRNRLLGLWAAGRMGFDADAARAYAQAFVRAASAGMGEDDVLARVRDDLRAKEVAVGEQELRGRMAELLAEARAQLMQEAARDD